ncbi:hypothetical protein [Aureivirga sp. CE67]|uniref:hypothetical protein n=1 Tax=Aureivirga sp. CE67 TaxID=1788983 RepID=UPI0018CBC875|nr:hypothetical protein [Aureivirga sp. CE67]
MLATSIALIQEVPDIKQKIKDAPNSDYEIGATIGSFIPLVILIIFAYIIYYRMKKIKDLDK